MPECFAPTGVLTELKTILYDFVQAEGICYNELVCQAIADYLFIHKFRLLRSSLPERDIQTPVIQEALTPLQERELEEAYRQASAELDANWDVVVADGLTDETW